MKWLADENVDKAIITRLRQDGLSVEAIAETATGVSDDAIIDRANALSALLITQDKDFGELVFRQRRATCGVLLLRLSELTSDGAAERVSTAITTHQQEMAGNFTVITLSGVRIRTI